MAEEQRKRDEEQRLKDEKEAEDRAKAEQEENLRLQKQVRRPSTSTNQAWSGNLARITLDGLGLSDKHQALNQRPLILVLKGLLPCSSTSHFNE